MDSLSGKILGVTATTTNYFLENLKQNTSPILILDILIVAIIFYWVYIFLKETRAMRILYGFLFLFLLWIMGKILDLILLNWILQSMMAILIVAIPIVFQPELRSALERLGRTKFLGEMAFSNEEYNRTIKEILNAVNSFSKQKTGALIVLKRQTGLREYIDSAISVNAKVSSLILQSIFFPRSPLHDGAVIISGNKIISAGSVLPVSQANLSSNLGTRHKAAVGITENSDAVAIIVSEETGAMSLAVSGKLDYKLSEERFKSRLLYLMGRYIKN